MQDPPDLGSIRAFMAIAQAESVSAGAARVGLTRSAAGKALTRLEARLGARLLHRTTRSVSLTAEGQLFLDRCAQILADLADAEAAVRQDAPEPSGTLRLTLPETFGRAHVLPVLHDFLARWPGLSAEVSLTDRFVDIIDESYDLAIRCGARLSDTRMIARVVARSRTVICAAPEYLARQGEPHDADDLLRHSRLTLRGAGAVRPWLLEPRGGPTVRIGSPGRLHLDSGTALREAAVAGLGIACLPLFLVEADLDAARLVALLADYETEELLIHALYPHRRHLAAKIRLFVDRLCEATMPIPDGFGCKDKAACAHAELRRRATACLTN